MGRVDYAREVIGKVEIMGVENLMTKEELKIWERNYNNVNNEGGEGYVPHVICKEEYDWALGVIADEEPAQEEVVVAEVEEVVERAVRIEEDLKQAEMIAMGEETPKTVIIELGDGSRRHPSWLAQITGTCPRYKFSREFVKDMYNRPKDYEIGNGLYEVCDCGERYFIEVVNGKFEIVRDSDIAELVG